MTTLTLGPPHTYTWTYDVSASPLINTYTSLTASLQVWPVMIIWQSSDLVQSTSTSTLIMSNDTSAPAVASSDSLPTGAKIGIGVAAGVIAVLILIIAGFMVRLQRAKMAQKVSTESAPDGLGWKPELDGAPSPTMIRDSGGSDDILPAAAQDVHVIHEIEGTDTTANVELGSGGLGSKGRAELGGS